MPHPQEQEAKSTLIDVKQELGPLAVPSLHPCLYHQLAQPFRSLFCLRITFCLLFLRSHILGLSQRVFAPVIVSVPIEVLFTLTGQLI